MKGLLLLLSAATIVLAAGCASPEETAGNGNYTPPTPAEVDKKIAAIDADPHMPQSAKDMQKAMLQKNGTGQKGQSGK